MGTNEVIVINGLNCRGERHNGNIIATWLCIQIFPYLYEEVGGTPPLKYNSPDICQSSLHKFVASSYQSGICIQSCYSLTIFIHFQLIGWHYLMWVIWTFLIPVFIIPVIFMGIFYGVCAIKVTKQLGKTCIFFEEYGMCVYFQCFLSFFFVLQVCYYSWQYSSQLCYYARVCTWWYLSCFESFSVHNLQSEEQLSA